VRIDRNRPSRPGLRQPGEADLERFLDDHEIPLRAELAAAHCVNHYLSDGMAVAFGVHEGSRYRN
jgi:hypothetical protein